MNEFRKKYHIYGEIYLQSVRKESGVQLIKLKIWIMWWVFHQCSVSLISFSHKPSRHVYDSTLPYRIVFYFISVFVLVSKVTHLVNHFCSLVRIHRYSRANCQARLYGLASITQLPRSPRCDLRSLANSRYPREFTRSSRNALHSSLFYRAPASQIGQAFMPKRRPTIVPHTRDWLKAVPPLLNGQMELALTPSYSSP